MAARRFPPGFLWGTATAAHQVEGQNDNNQWWDWEQQAGRIWHGDRSGDACGWWRDPLPDLDRAAALGQNAHRLSIEWSRIEPRDGHFDTAALDHYRDLLQACQQRSLTPMVTLHHFTNPHWLEQRGGWLHPETPQRFANFVERAVEHLGEHCTLWCTINEPLVYAVQSYLMGLWPPGMTSMPHTFRIVAAMLRGHAAAARAIHNVQPYGQVGIVHNLRLFDPASPALHDVGAAMMLDRLFNGLLLEAITTGRLPIPLSNGLEVVPGLLGSCDFFGLNYYTRDHVAFDPRLPQSLFARRFTPEHVPQSDKGRDGHTYGEIYPHGLYRALKRVARLGLPIYITETGLPDADDDQRPQFLLDHLGAVHRAISEGIDVRGVFLWSLLDNFEWSEGWDLRFGLYAFDQHTGTRTLRRSGALYAIFARANALPDLA